MIDEFFLSLNQTGFFPGPSESEKDFLKRVARMKRKYEALGDSQIPSSHWDWVRNRLCQIFDFRPEYLTAFYSNRSLMPWQGAAIWIEEEGEISIQLRTSLKKGSFLGLYDREEILAHEAVHAARAGFAEDRWEEFFAFMSSHSRWRRVLGPIVQRPWEVWPFLISCFVGPIFSGGFILAALWATLGFGRLMRQHRLLKKASDQLAKEVKDPRKIRAVLVRLSDAEICSLSRGEKIGDSSFRWKMIRESYFK